MTAQVYLHIGPPKTATTSLQVALQGLDHPQLVYFGVRQPRAEFANTDLKLLNSISKGEPTPEHEFNNLRDKIKKYISEDKVLFLSEEMFTVGQSKTEIREKITHLITFFQRQIETTPCVILTLRDPVDALPSYYQEIFRSLPFELASDFTQFCRDGRTFCYDYSAIIGHINKCGAHLHILLFEDLASGSLSSQALLGATTDLNFTLRVGKTNVGKRTSDAVDKRTIPDITLGQKLRDSPLFRLIKLVGINRLPGWRVVSKRIRQVTYRRAKEQSLEIPGDARKRFTESYSAAMRSSLSGED